MPMLMPMAVLVSDELALASTDDELMLSSIHRNKASGGAARSDSERNSRSGAGSEAESDAEASDSDGDSDSEDECDCQGECECEPEQENLKADKPETNIASKTAKSAPRMPRLRPVALEPLNCSLQAPSSRDLLVSLDRVAVSDFERAPSGVTYYVVDSFRLRCDSRIPTLRQQQRLRLLSRQQPDAAPEFRVRRRYSDFAVLRQSAIDCICSNAMFVCPLCAAFEHFSMFSMAQPRLLVRLTTTAKMRQQVLGEFLDELLAVATERKIGHVKECALYDKLPLLLAEFLADANAAAESA